MLDYEEICKLIPHRYPFLMIDRVLEVEAGKSCSAIKCISANDPFFQGHFPGHPIMPGVLVVEALAQTAGIAIAMCDTAHHKLGLFTGIEKMKFRHRVVPGDVLTLKAEIIQFKRNFATAAVIAKVNEDTAAEGEIKFLMTERPNP
ncbi:MAG: 3-hydroxyacyl-ACP dehydratase FabZ [Eubacteriales bacterium]|nr:3-hydroxyacyl-ACP dehydratase FabZ [Eubacteriales bacterium]